MRRLREGTTVRGQRGDVTRLSEAAEAHRLVSTNQVSGNLVLLPWAE